MRKPNLRKGLKYTAFFILYIHLVFIQLTIPVLILYRYVNPPITGVMAYRKLGFGWDFQKIRFRPIAEIPSRTRRMILKVEDGTFYEHHGILPAAMKNAWRINKEIGKPVYGGSTITMQTARTLFLSPTKSYVRKYLEVILAVEMEAILGKDRIFELYLNYAEWGKGIFGIEAASRHHYKKTVSKLTTDEAVRLVTLLSSPVKYGPYTLERSGILRSRYQYLSSRFN